MPVIPDFSPQHIVDTILLAMNEADISQRELATHLDLSEPRISQILRPSSNMTIGTLNRVWQAIARIKLRREIADIERVAKERSEEAARRLFGPCAGTKHVRPYA